MLNGDGLRVVLWVAGCGHACPAVTTPSHGTQKAVCCLISRKGRSCSPSSARTISPASRFPASIRFSPATARRSASCAARFGKSFRIRPSGCIPVYEWEEICHLSFLSNIDVIVDGKFKIEEKDNIFTGKDSANQRVIDVKASLRAGEVRLYQE
mgnify:CR=1 FL=1